MNPLGNRARAEELARLLDGAVAGPGSLTAGHAALAGRLRALAAALDAVAVPRPEFRAALRQRLVAVATVQAAAAVDAPYASPLARPKALEAAATWAQGRRAQRRLGVVAGAMAGVVAFTGVGVAASQSLPGQPFYGLKRTAEDVQLSFADGDTAKGTKHLEFAATRLREVRALAHGDGQLSLGGGSTPVAGGTAWGGTLQERIDSTLAAFDSQTKSGQSLLEKVYRRTGKPEPLRVLKSFSAQQRSRLTSLLPQLPAAVQDDARASLALVTDVGTQATQLLALGTCGGECYPGNAGPQLPASPDPTPGATASPSDDNGVPACACVQPTRTPEPTPAAQPSPTATPNGEPTPATTPTPAPSASSSPTPGLIPDPLATLLPTLPPILPSPLPTLLPLPLPTLLPLPLPTGLLGG